MKTIERVKTNTGENDYADTIDISAVKFNTGNTLLIDRETNEITLVNKNKLVQLVISLTDDGLVLNLDASKINIHSSGELNLSGKKINIEGSEQVNITTSGNFVQQIDKDSLTEVKGTNKTIAKIQKIAASLGNVEIKANDDVLIDGERIKLNCD